MSEEFGGRLPSEIWAERAKLPAGFLEQIIEYRTYAATKAAYDHQQNPKAKPPMWQLVERIEYEIAADQLGVEFRE